MYPNSKKRELLQCKKHQHYCRLLNFVLIVVAVGSSWFSNEFGLIFHLKNLNVCGFGSQTAYVLSGFGLNWKNLRKTRAQSYHFGALSYWWIQFSMQQTETTQLFADCRGMHTCPSTNQHHNRLTGLCARIRHCIAFAHFSFHLILFSTHTYTNILSGKLQHGTSERKYFSSNSRCYRIHKGTRSISPLLYIIHPCPLTLAHFACNG